MAHEGSLTAHHAKGGLDTMGGGGQLKEPLLLRNLDLDGGGGQVRELIRVARDPLQQLGWGAQAFQVAEQKLAKLLRLNAVGLPARRLVKQFDLAGEIWGSWHEAQKAEALNTPREDVGAAVRQLLDGLDLRDGADLEDLCVRPARASRADREDAETALTVEAVPQHLPITRLEDM
jgi:hypothetical protein